MQKPVSNEERTCPICGRSYTGQRALARTDKETLVCPDCGTRQALASSGVDEKEQEEILATIHRNCDGRN